MPDAPPNRTSLEPLAPAIVGIGFAIVVIGIVAWTLIPLLATPEDPPTHPDLVWRSPDALAPPVEKNQAPAEKPPSVTEPALSVPAPTAPAVAAVAAASSAMGATPFSPPAHEMTSMPSTAPAAAASIEPTPPAPAPTAKALNKAISPSSTPAPAKPETPAAVDTLPPATLADTLGSATGMEGSLFRPRAAGLSAQMGLGAGSMVHSRSLPPPPSAATSPPASSVPSQPRAQPAVEAGKFISVSMDLPDPPQKSGTKSLPRPVPSLLDIAIGNDTARRRAEITGGTDVSRAEQALQSALLAAWQPPPLNEIPIGQRSVMVRLHLLKDGTVEKAAILTPSGSSALDASVAEALKKVVKISESLPAKFPSSHYSLRVHLRID